MANAKGFGLDLDMLKRISRDHLIRILEDSPGTKDLVIDGDLMKLLDRIADASTLRAHGVGRMFRLERVPPPVSSSQLVYIMNPCLANVKSMCDHLHTFEDLSIIKVVLVCVPRILPVTNIFLEEEGFHGIVKVHEFSPNFISLDTDILSLEMNTFFRDVFLRGDLSGCVSIARALSTMENLFGSFPSIMGHGRASQVVLKTLNLIQEEQKRSGGSSIKYPPTQTPEVSHLFVFDRDADFVTPLLTQLTYEGSLDEQFGIKAGIVELPNEVTGTDHPSKVLLNSQDTVFDHIRNRHFGGVSSHLVRRARELQERQQSTSTMTTAQMKDFVSNELRTVQALQKSLSLHLSACEAITKNTRKDFEAQLMTEHGVITGGVSISEAKDYIKDCIARQLPSSLSLRLLCLYSITQKGLARKEYEKFATQFLCSYGYSHLTTLHHLRTMGLLLIAEANADESSGSGIPVKTQVLRQVVSSLGVRNVGHWSHMVKKLNLIPGPDEDIDLHNPTHMSYVFNGAYTPAIPQLLNMALTNGFASVQEAVKSFPGTSYMCLPKEPDKCSFHRAVLVVILGGVTFAEIACFRLLSVILSTKIIIASTNTITGTTLIKSAIQK